MTESKEDRKEGRLPKNYMVHVTVEGFEGAALTSNISPHGMLVLFHDVIPLELNRDIEVLIAIESRMFTLRGRMKWSKKLPENFLVGIEILNPSEEFTTYWSRMTS